MSIPKAGAIPTVLGIAYNGKDLINSSRVDLFDPCMTHCPRGIVDLKDQGRVVLLSIKA